MDSSNELFEDNKNFQIDNPLVRKSRAELEADADDFAKAVNSAAPDIALFRKAALIAQDPTAWRSVEGLTRQEIHAIEKEGRLGFWRQPKALRATVITLCFSAIIQGWVQTSLNGANQGWPRRFGLYKKDSTDFANNQAGWIFAGVNSISKSTSIDRKLTPLANSFGLAYFTAAIFGAWLSDPLQSMILGRRGAIMVAAIVSLVSVIGAGAAQTWQELLICRAIVGVSMGAKASVTPIFGAEVAPSHLRGALVMNWQLFDALGIFLGFTANLILWKAGNVAWRYQMGAAALPAVCLLCLVWVIPESPRWLLKKGRLSQAFDSTVQLRRTPLQAAVELFYANAQIQTEISLLPQKVQDQELGQGWVRPPHRSRRESSTENSEKAASGPSEGAPENNRSGAHQLWRYIAGRVAAARIDEYQERVNATSYAGRFFQLFRKKRIARATLAAFVVMISQQLCGINAIIMYSSTIFSGNGKDSSNQSQTISDNDLRALWLSWGIGLANFVMTFPAWFVAKIGELRDLTLMLHAELLLQYKIYWLIDSFGRRSLLLISYPGMFFSLLAATLSYSGGRHIATLAVFTFIFVFFYSWGQGVVPFAYSSEVFPLLNREVGMSFSVAANLFGVGILTMFVPKLTEAWGGSDEATGALGQQRLLGLFTGLIVLAYILIFLFVPETAGAALNTKDDAGEQTNLSSISLEEINYIFGASTRQHIRYQIYHVLPWACKMCIYGIKRSVFRNEVVKPARWGQAYTWKRNSVQVLQHTTVDEIS